MGGWPEPGPLPELPPLPEDEAILLIQANERGRQARDRAQAMYTFKRQRQLEDRRARSGIVCSSSLQLADSLPTHLQFGSAQLMACCDGYVSITKFYANTTLLAQKAVSTT